MTNISSQFSIHNSPFPIFTIVAFSLALNLHALAADSFWGDEIFTAIFASRPPTEVIRWTAEDIHPPLYYLLAGGITRLTVPLGTTENPSPASDWLWRFPSVVAVVLTVTVTYRLAFHVSRFTLPAPRSPLPILRAIATSAALLLAVSPIAIKYGQEARMHALFMFLSALSTWLFFRAMAQPRKWTRWLAFALATSATIYTMYFGFLILAAQASLLLFTILYPRFSAKPPGGTLHAPRSPAVASHSPLLVPRLIGFTTATALACLLYLPWWPVLFDILRKRAVVGAIEGGVGHPLDFVQGVVRALGPMPELVAWTYLLLFFIGLVFMAQRYWPMATFASLWLVLPVALPIFLGDPRALQFRYAFVLPIYLTVIAFAIWQIAGRAARALRQTRETDLQRPREGSNRYLGLYLIWILATVSFVATLRIYAQPKPDWRSAAAYLNEHAEPADIILIGPLWDEGRFLGYYYRGQAQLLTPAAMVTNIERRVEAMRAGGGRVWAINRFTPAESQVAQHHVFSGSVVLSEPTLAVYEPVPLTEAAIDLAAQAVDAATSWASEAEAQGVLNPDPRTARAAALRAWGDVLVAAGRPEDALGPYQTAVDIFPGWAGGFIALAETQELVGNLPAAAEAYRQAVAYNLDWQGPPAVEAAALVAGGQWAAALEKYHKIIKVK